MLDTGPLSTVDAVTLLGRLKKRLAGEFSYNDYPLWAKAIDRVVTRIDGSRDKRTALDRRVQEILAGEPYVSQRALMKADRELFDRAMGHIDYNMHQNWEVRGHKGLFPEPAKGKRDPEAWDQWINRPRYNVVEPLSELQKSYDKLSRVHTNYMEKISVPPTTSVLTRGGSGTTPEEEESPK